MALTVLFLLVTPDSLFAWQPAAATQSQIPQTKGKTFRQGKRLFHITPQGDTIVLSFSGKAKKSLRKKQSIPGAKTTEDAGPPSNPLSPLYGLNSYVPAHDSDYVSNLDWYGSGDVNGDGKIDMKDYNALKNIYDTNPYYSKEGHYRGDINMNGIAGDAEDKKELLEFIEGKRKELNVWELETAAQKLEHLKKALKIDPTNKIRNPDWFCSDYTNQLYIDFNGVYNIKASGLAGSNATSLPYDTTHNGIFRIPLREVSTMTADNIAHSINDVFMGSPKQQDAGKFKYRVYIEPQTDVIQKVGDYSLNKYANETWYGYSYSSLFGWGYGSRRIVNYNLNSDGTVTKVFEHPNLVKSWNPAENVKYPSDKVKEFPADTSVEANGRPTNLYGIWGKASYSDSSNQTHNGTRSDVNYVVKRTWGITTGAYTPENTPDAVHEQKIKVEDTTPPTYEKGENGPTNIKDNSGLPVTVTTDTLSTRGTNPDQCSYYTYTKTPEYILTDISGNKASYEGTPIQTTNKPPYLVAPAINGKDTVYLNVNMSISPDSIPDGWAKWKDPENGPMTKSYSDKLVKETSLYKLWHRIETASDPCEVSPDSAKYFIQQNKPTGIEEKTLSGKAIVYPNPSINEKITLKYSSSVGQTLRATLYNIQGQKLEEKAWRLTTGENHLTLRLPRSGIYFLKLTDESGHIQTLRLVRKR